MRLISFAISLLIFLAISPIAMANPKLTPQVITHSWVEANSELASITLNGQDLIWFKGQLYSGEASDQAEKLAAQLQESLSDPTLESGSAIEAAAQANSLFPLEVKGAVEPGSNTPLNSLQTSSRIARAIRIAYGLPPTLSTQLTKKPRVIAAHPDANKQFAGRASWYGGKFHGRKASDGSRFNQHAMTAAHRSLPFGTRLLVVNRRTGDTCIVKITDRGPFVGNRILDLSYGAAKRLNMISSGTALVDCLVLGSQ